MLSILDLDDFIRYNKKKKFNSKKQYIFIIFCYADQCLDIDYKNKSYLHLSDIISLKFHTCTKLYIHMEFLK